MNLSLCLFPDMTFITSSGNGTGVAPSPCSTCNGKKKCPPGIIKVQEEDNEDTQLE